MLLTDWAAAHVKLELGSSLARKPVPAHCLHSTDTGEAWNSGPRLHAVHCHSDLCTVRALRGDNDDRRRPSSSWGSQAGVLQGFA
jgi:hypothetical protein